MNKEDDRAAQEHLADVLHDERMREFDSAEGVCGLCGEDIRSGKCDCPYPMTDNEARAVFEDDLP